MPERDWRDITGLLKARIEAEEDKSFNYTKVRTPIMRKFERVYGIDLVKALRREPLDCGIRVRFCSRDDRQICFYHKYGVEGRISRMWRCILGMTKTNQRVRNLLDYLSSMESLAESNKQVRVPLVLRREDLRLVIQALGLVPEDLELEK